MKEFTEDIDMLVQSSPVLLLQFGEDTCAPCHAIRFKLDQWLEEHPGVIARYVDIEKNLALCSQMGIFSAPTVIAYVDGNIAARESGYFSLDTFLDRVERYLELFDLTMKEESKR